MKSSSLILLMILSAVIPLAAATDYCAADTVVLTPTENHHIAELNSHQPYVAGYHVETPDLYTRERVDATAITVSFPSTDASYFPSDSWLGAGMFVQGQDSKLRHVDYAYYTMLVIDSSSNFFIDIGLHETRESTAPLQMPTEEIVYAYTWQLSGINPAAQIDLVAKWDSNEYLHYSLSSADMNKTLLSIKVASLPNCESVISKFYAGTAVAGTAFPQGHYVYYFQFGVVSDKIISDTHWSAHLKEPRILRKAGWNRVETAWTIQGDISYLDYDWLWGGAPYQGVHAEYHRNPLQNPYEVVFSYTGQTLSRGTILWESGETSRIAMIPPTVFNQPFDLESKIIIAFEILTLSGVAVGAVRCHKLRKKASSYHLSNSELNH